MAVVRGSYRVIDLRGQRIVMVGKFVSPWMGHTAYAEKDLVLHDGRPWRCKVNHISGEEFDPSMWEEGGETDD